MINKLFISDSWIDQFNEYFNIKFKVENNKLLAFYKKKQYEYLNSIEVIEIDNKTSKIKFDHNVEDETLLKSMKEIEDKIIKNFNLTNTIVTIIQELDEFYKKNINTFDKSEVKEILIDFLKTNVSYIKNITLNGRLLENIQINKNELNNLRIKFNNDFFADFDFSKNIKVVLFVDDTTNIFDSLNSNKILNAPSISGDNFKQSLKHILKNVIQNNYTYFGQEKINKKIFTEKLLKELNKNDMKHSGYKSTNQDHYTLFFNYNIFELFIKDNIIELFHNKDEKLNLIIQSVLIENNMNKVLENIPKMIESFLSYKEEFIEEFEF